MTTTAPARAVDVSVAPVTVPPLPAGTAPAAPAPVAGATGGCRAAGARVSRVSSAAARAAVVCLINQQRARGGRGALAADARLGLAAGRHAADMARRHYFSHVSPSGRTPSARARAAGWHGQVGEMIAWGCGALATARATVRAWMASAPHRAIMLGPGRAVGVGFNRGPGCGGRAYWVAVVG